jgi:uncharacterized membrane protein YphA (DoxX/SURF4 family)
MWLAIRSILGCSFFVVDHLDFCWGALPRRVCASGPDRPHAVDLGMVFSLPLHVLHRLRRKRWANLAVVNLRILLGFAFLPAGLKKVIGQRFTDLANHGPFHDFLHAFYDTGLFYSFVGALQLVAALLLMTQRFALLGALLAFPIFTAILAFCWSTGVVFTAVMVTLMWSATVGLLIWDSERLRPLVQLSWAQPGGEGAPTAPIDPPIDLSLWARCGWAIFLLYLATCGLAGGVYRPRGVELDQPAFYVLPSIALIPVVTYFLDRRRRRRHMRELESPRPALESPEDRCVGRRN